jgi:hypothetical protein
VKEIRKLSKTSYTATINIDEEAKKVLVQVEADKIEDLAGNKNENASNEISVKVIPGKPSAESVAGKDGEGETSIDSLLNKIISSAPQCTYNGSGILITIGPDGKPLNTTSCSQSQTQNLAGNNANTYDCNGQKIPVTQPCQQQMQTVCTTTQNPFTGQPQQQCQQMNQQQAQAKQQEQQNQQLGQLLGGLMKAGGFGGDQNRSGGGGGSNGGGVFGGGGGGVPVPQSVAALKADLKDGEKRIADLNIKKENCTPKPECQKAIDKQVAMIEEENASIDRRIRGRGGGVGVADEKIVGGILKYDKDEECTYSSTREETSHASVLGDQSSYFAGSGAGGKGFFMDMWSIKTIGYKDVDNQKKQNFIGKLYVHENQMLSIGYKDVADLKKEFDRCFIGKIKLLKNTKCFNMKEDAHKVLNGEGDKPQDVYIIVDSRETVGLSKNQFRVSKENHAARTLGDIDKSTCSPDIFKTNAEVKAGNLTPFTP